jgi:hypothetical protein
LLIQLHQAIEGLSQATQRVGNVVEKLDREIAALTEAVKSPPHLLKAKINRFVAEFAIGVSLAGAGCCPPKFPMEGYSEGVRGVANGTWICTIMGCGIGFVGIFLGFL